MEEQPTSNETAPPKKSYKRGCLIAALIVIGLIIILLILGIYGFYRFSKTEQGQAIIGLTKAVAEGSQAPGAAELREMGCTQAFVIEMEQLAKLESIPGIEIPKDQMPTGKVAVCQVSSLENAPSCDAAAQTYVRTFGDEAPHPFTVIVADMKKGVECIQSYSGDGTPEP